MPSYHYQAITPSGKSQKGSMDAANEKQVRDLLREQQLIPINIRMAASVKWMSWHPTAWSAWLNRRPLSSQAIALFTRQFATLLSAGLPVEAALQAVAEQTESLAVRALITSVRASVMEGHALAVAMEAHPQAFSPLFCATIAAGERTGHLDHILLRLADYTEQQATLRQKLKTALIYPSMIVCVSFGIVSFLLAYVVPKMVGVYGHMKQALPLMTQILIALSHGLEVMGAYLLVGVMVLVMLFLREMKRRPAFRYRVHVILLRLPLVGYVAKTADTARFARTLSILCAAGVPALDAMRVASGLMTSLPIKAAVGVAVSRVREGAAIHLALKNTGYFTPMCTHMIASGEASGKLDDMLVRVANQQEGDVTRLIDVSLALFEPAVILLMGAIVLFIVLAVLLPIFQLNDMVS